MQPVVVLKISCLSHINTRYNNLDTVSKRKIMRIKVGSSKGIFTKSEDFLDVCRNNHDDLTLVDPSMHLLPRDIQDMPCHRLVLIYL